ncbi:MAG TPA: DUF2339 domain-containing protein [Blastocatellia bacterium]|nr:DUF2339 domain-containing protein [Blastocatellia bacterium]
MADEDSSRDRIDQLIERINELENYLRQHASRLYAIERRLGIAPQFQQQPPTVPEKRPPVDYERPKPGDQTLSNAESTTLPPPKVVTTDMRPRETQVQTPKPSIEKPAVPPPPRRVLNAPVPQGPPPVSASRAGNAAKARTDLEARIGGSWFNRIGIIAVALGVGFFLKYAFDNQWIGAWGRVMIGVAIGLGFLIAGERLRPRYRNYAFGLTGGGILILYLSIYAAYRFFSPPLIDPLPAFICMAIVTAAASLLSARYNALPIAVLGLIGGFLTPVLLSTGQDNEAGLFGYIALLDLGVLALAYSKQWRSLNYMAFTATVLMVLAWHVEYYAQEKLWVTMFFLTLFFVIFALLAVLYNVVNRRPTLWADLALVFLNALLYFGASYLWLEVKYEAYLGVFAVIVSTFYLALGYFAFKRDREDRLLLYTFWGLAILFAVLAVPIQFNQHWVTMSWAIEGAILTWIGLRVEDKTSRYASLIVFLIAVSHWLLVDIQDFAYHANETFLPLLNSRALSCAVLVAALAAAASFYKRYGSNIDDQERSMFSVIYTLGANALAVTLLSMDANDYFEQARARAYEQAGRPDNFNASERFGRLVSAQNLTLSALWMIYGGTALTVGIKRNLKAIRVGALLLLAGAGVKLLVNDLIFDYDAQWHRTIFNHTFVAFALFVAVCAIGAWLYSKASNIDKAERTLVTLALVGAANLFAIIALSAEAVGHFEREKALAGNQPVANLENMKQLALSAVWVTYGAVSLIAGILLGRKFLRITSLILLALATVKLMLVDLTYYDAPWHSLVVNQTFAAFALLVAALAAGVLFYSRAENIDEDERSKLIPVMIAAANILAIIALSAESYGYYAVKINATSDAQARLEDLRLAQQLSISVIWTIYGGAMLTMGIIRRSRLLRVMALALLGLTIFKVFLIDLSLLEKLYRIISFIVLGAILLVVSFLYQRYRQRAAEMDIEEGGEEQARVDNFESQI